MYEIYDYLSSLTFPAFVEEADVAIKLFEPPVEASPVRRIRLLIEHIDLDVGFFRLLRACGLVPAFAGLIANGGGWCCID